MYSCLKRLHFILFLSFLSSLSSRADELSDVFQELGNPEEFAQQLSKEFNSISKETNGTTTPQKVSSETVNVNELKLVGRGIVDKKTGDSIALAYVDIPDQIWANRTLKNCIAIKFVHFDYSTLTARTFGQSVFEACEGNLDERTLKKLTKSVDRNFKRFLSHKYKLRNGLIIVGLGTAMIPLCLFVGPAVFSSSSVNFLVYYVSVYGIYGIGKLIEDGIRINRPNDLSKVIIDKNGWNWSISPHRMSHRKFKLFYQFASSTVF